MNRPELDKSYIGKKYKTRGGLITTIKDIATTRLESGQIISQTYVTESMTLGQTVVNYEVVKASIDMAVIKRGWVE